MLVMYTVLDDFEHGLRRRMCLQSVLVLDNDEAVDEINSMTPELCTAIGEDLPLWSSYCLHAELQKQCAYFVGFLVSRRDFPLFCHDMACSHRKFNKSLHDSHAWLHI
jgi:hypothetical protein